MRQLRDFATVARFGSFTRASETLGLSQPALTMAVRQLEEALGMRLFDRTTRRVQLTPEGEDLLPTAERLLNDFDFAINDARAVAARRRGQVGVAAVYSIATLIMPKAVADFSQRYPMIKIHLRDDNSSGVRKRVRLNEVDFGFAGRDDDPELEAESILRDRVGLMARADHPLMQDDDPVPWSALAPYDCLGLAPDTGIRPLVDNTLGIPDSVRAPRFEVSSTPTLEAMVLAGLGVSAVPTLALPDGTRNGLRLKPLVGPVVYRDVYLLTRRGRSLSSAAEEMKATILRYVGELRAKLNLD